MIACVLIRAEFKKNNDDDDDDDDVKIIIIIRIEYQK
jgi:hypothetical protein